MMMDALDFEMLSYLPFLCVQLERDFLKTFLPKLCPVVVCIATLYLIHWDWILNLYSRIVKYYVD